MNTPRRPRWKSRLLAVVAIAGLGAGALVAALPSLVAGPGQPWLVARLDAAVPGGVRLESLELGWRGPQRVSGLALLDPDGRPVLRIAAATLETPLSALVTRVPCRGEIVLEGVDARLALGAPGGSNLHRALGLQPADGSATEPAHAALAALLDALDCRLTVADSGFRLAAPGVETLRVSALEATFEVRGRDTLEAAATARLHPGTGDPGRLELDARADGLLDVDGRLQPERASAAVEARLTQVPVGLLDRLGGLDGRLEALLGPTLAPRLQASWRDGGGRVALDVGTARGGGLRAALTARDGRLALAEPAVFSTTVVPGDWPTLAPGERRLQRPLAIDARVTALALPTARPGDARFTVELDLGDLELGAPGGDAVPGGLALRGARAVGVLIERGERE